MTVESASKTGAKVVIATTVALAFISFWRAAAIVLSDLASSAFYAGGIAEQAVGRSAPWFVLGVMLFSFAVRSVYIEGSSMFVRGGVYVVVRDSMGPAMAKLSVSALVFDYILTGPISVVSAGQYMGALMNEISEMLHQTFRINVNNFSAALAIAGPILSRTTTYTPPRTNMLQLSMYTLRTAKLNSMTPSTNHGAALPIACSAAPPA